MFIPNASDGKITPKSFAFAIFVNLNVTTQKEIVVQENMGWTSQGKGLLDNREVQNEKGWK